MRSHKVNAIRIALVLSLVIVNGLVFRAAGLKAKSACSDCVSQPGGAVGHYADCVPGSTIQLCSRDGIDDCLGYPCGADDELETPTAMLSRLFTAR